jgi:hypothetical protein
MNKHATTLDIKTLGCFSSSINGRPVARVWPNETLKVFFCSLLSPLDLYFTWDRMSRSMLGEPETRTSRHRLEELCVRPLNCFLIEELGFNPLIAGQDSIRIDPLRIRVDAIEFYDNTVGGLNLAAHGNHAAALDKFKMAQSLYTGSYLPDITGKIIANTRNDLESFYNKIVMYGVRHYRSA